MKPGTQRHMRRPDDADPLYLDGSSGWVVIAVLVVFTTVAGLIGVAKGLASFFGAR